jgi:type I restriction enzyme R subunit
MQFSDTSERGLQQYIVKELVASNHFIETNSKDFDTEFCINPKQLWRFIKTTQPETYAMLERKGKREFLLRLDKKITKLGVIEVLRKGVKHLDKTVDLFYRQPASTLNPKDNTNYQANIFTVTQELQYSSNNANRLDLCIFLNGIALITSELKNPLTGQTVANAMRQYQTDRDPKDKIFSFARCMVHFAVDTEQVFMTTKLNNKKTDFLPFNKGLNAGKATGKCGAGNPVNPNGLKTHYLWEEVLTKNSLANIIDNFAKITSEDIDGKTKKVMIFPRYHQLTAVRQLLDHSKQYGIGNKYLIQHSAGSGKSKSIAWLAHQLHGLFDTTGTKNIFDSIIVITDRVVLDKQLSEDIKQFSPKKGIVAHITSDSNSKTDNLKQALADQKKVIICTVQTFPFLLDEMLHLANSKFGIIIDEAHSGQSGQTSSKMNAILAEKQPEQEETTSLEDQINELIASRKMITNGSYFAFTATPKNKTLETFGVKSTDTYIDENGKTQNKFYAFHLYSMQQATEEGFILDVLKNYTTYNSYYKLIKIVDGNPEFDSKQAQKKLRTHVEGHEFAINEKAKIMIDHFHYKVKHLINNQAKSMIVTKSVEVAIKYKQAFDKYLQEINSPFKAIVAFSGTKELKGIEYNENSMNKCTQYKNNIPKNFKRTEYKFLIVAEKYQTGFDEPLLHTMYVDKKLAGIKAVQTLSRLNRANKAKKDTFVLDFYNDTTDIKYAFEPYYTTTTLATETDPNKLHDLIDDLENFEVYSLDDVNDFFAQYINTAERHLLDPILDNSTVIFKNNLDDNQQIDFKSKAKAFLRLYSYLAKILDFANQQWEKIFWFLRYLVPKLFITKDDDLTEGLIESIKLDSYRSSKQTTESIILNDSEGEVAPIPAEAGAGKAEVEIDTLENIMNDFNQRFGDIEWSDKDKIYKILTQDLPKAMQENSEVMDKIKYSDKQNAKISSDNNLKKIIHNLLTTNTEIYQKFTENEDFQRRYKEFIFDIVYNKSKKDTL